MKPGFMTSVYPQKTLPELVDIANSYGYKGIEFRTEWKHQHGVELDAPAASIAAARKTLADAGVAASCIASGVRFNFADRAEHLPQRETLRRYIALAANLGAPVIRTFGDKLPEDDDAQRQEVLRLAAESYASVDEWAGQHGVTVLVETHTNMRGEFARSILDMAGASNLAVLWHIGHHLSRGQSVDEAHGYIGKDVRHVHFSMNNERAQDAENGRMFELLAKDEYSGFISVEVINPEDPAGILKFHMEKYRQFADAVQA